MFFRLSRLIASLVLLGWTSGTALPAAAAEPYEESGKQHSWFSLNRPARDNSADQLEYANQLRERGKIGKAIRQFRALIATWPGTRDAAAAQYMIARLEEDRGRLVPAFDAYQALMDNYAGRVPYQRILSRQFELAREVMESPKGGFFFFPGFEAPERAIPLLEKIIANGPRSPYAAEAQYLIGSAYEDTMEYELAIVSYLIVQHRYPASPFAEEAAFARARTLHKLSQSQPNDEETLGEAWAAANLFLNAYPQSDYAQEVLDLRQKLYEAIARNAYEVALYYDRHTRRPAAALKSYQEFLRQFPNSRWSNEVQTRIVELSKTVNPKDHEDDSIAN